MIHGGSSCPSRIPALDATGRPRRRRSTTPRSSRTPRSAPITRYGPEHAATDEGGRRPDRAASPSTARSTSRLNGGPMFPLSEAISFQIMCGDQEEADHYWTRAHRGRRGEPVRLAQGQVRRLAGRSSPPEMHVAAPGDPDPGRAQRATQAHARHAPASTSPGSGGRRRRRCRPDAGPLLPRTRSSRRAPDEG